MHDRDSLVVTRKVPIWMFQHELKRVPETKHQWTLRCRSNTTMYNKLHGVQRRKASGCTFFCPSLLRQHQHTYAYYYRGHKSDSPFLIFADLSRLSFPEIFLSTRFSCTLSTIYKRLLLTSIANPLIGTKYSTSSKRYIYNAFMLGLNHISS